MLVTDLTKIIQVNDKFEANNLQSCSLIAGNYFIIDVGFFNLICNILIVDFALKALLNYWLLLVKWFKDVVEIILMHMAIKSLHYMLLILVRISLLIVVASRLVEIIFQPQLISGNQTRHHNTNFLIIFFPSDPFLDMYFIIVNLVL